MIIDALSRQPYNRLFAVFFVPPRAKNDMNAGSVKEITEAHHRMDPFILRHALEEGIPVLRLFSHMMDAFGNIRQCAVNIEDDNFVCHRLLLIVMSLRGVALLAP